jgi:phage shock protein A
MHTLADTISGHRPEPLGPQVQAAKEAGNTTLNVGGIADELGIMGCPKEDLPPVLRKAREALEESARLKVGAEDQLRAGISGWRRYEDALRVLAELRKDLAAGEEAVNNLRALVEQLPQTFEAKWAQNLRFNRFGIMLADIGQAQQAREAVKLFPKALAALQTRIVQLETGIAAMEAEHGFSRPVAPAIPAPEAQAEEPQKTVYAFRGEQ